MEQNSEPYPDATPTASSCSSERPLLPISESTTGPDLYLILGVDKNATEDEIKRAYKKLALKYHPDKNIGDIHAAELFKKVNYANAILSNPSKRLVYDDLGSEGILMMDTLGEEEFAAHLLHVYIHCLLRNTTTQGQESPNRNTQSEAEGNPSRLLSCCCAIFAICIGCCYCCSCCGCCCHFCCGKCKPDMDEHENAVNSGLDQKEETDQNDQTPIISQPGPSGTAKSRPSKYEEPERPAAMPPSPVRSSSPSEKASIKSTPSSQVSYGTQSDLK